MVQQSDQAHSDPVVVAIERVLKVERDGIKVLRDSEEEARRLLAAARAEAAKAAQRADACIARLHAVYLQKLERDITELVAAQPSGAEHEHGYDRGALETAARRLAARLTGAT